MCNCWSKNEFYFNIYIYILSYNWVQLSKSNDLNILSISLHALGLNTIEKIYHIIEIVEKEYLNFNHIKELRKK